MKFVKIGYGVGKKIENCIQHMISSVLSSSLKYKYLNSSFLRMEDQRTVKKQYKGSSSGEV